MPGLTASNTASVLGSVAASEVAVLLGELAAHEVLGGSFPTGGRLQLLAFSRVA